LSEPAFYTTIFDHCANIRNVLTIYGTPHREVGCFGANAMAAVERDPWPVLR
jgi:hypothetical protein